MSKKIVVVDDEEIVRCLIKDLLSDFEYEVLEAENGQEGIALVKQELPDLVILDMNMPGLAGTAVSSVLASNDNTRNIPILFLTGYMSEEEAESLDNQMGDKLLLTKPFDNDSLCEIVRRVIGE